MKSMNTTRQREEASTAYLEESSTFLSSAIFAEITHHPSHLYYVLKRLLDVVLATLSIVILLPVFLVIGLWIKLHDGGSIFYFREMLGLNGRPYIMLKFRTMIPNADAYLEQHPELKL